MREREREKRSGFWFLLPYFVCSNQLKMLFTIIFYKLWLRFICLHIKNNMFETVRSLIFPSKIFPLSTSYPLSRAVSLYTHFFYSCSYTKSDLVFNVSDQRAYFSPHFILTLNSFSLISYEWQARETEIFYQYEFFSIQCYFLCLVFTLHFCLYFLFNFYFFLLYSLYVSPNIYLFYFYFFFIFKSSHHAILLLLLFFFNAHQFEKSYLAGLYLLCCTAKCFIHTIFEINHANRA